MKLDPAIAKSLSLDLGAANVTSHGGSGFSATAKIAAVLDGEEKLYFLKTSPGKDAEVMFQGEHESLNALHRVVPSLCPASFGHGQLADRPGTFYLVTDFLDLGVSSLGSRSASSSHSSGMSLATKLARLHTTPAPIPEGYTKPVFGFPVTTCCGDTPQPNNFTESWAHFYANHRLFFILGLGERNNGKDSDLRTYVERMANVVVPRLLGDQHLNNGKGIQPVVVHGDLWSGNKGRGRIGGKGGIEDVVFDPSGCYTHAEYDHGIMNMFGGFSSTFWREYHDVCPKTEPVDEYHDRVVLYELYHHLNHYAMFGGGYRSGAMSIMKKLWQKYGQ